MKHNSLLIFILFACTVPITVSAQSPRYARVISENANLRDAPSNSGASTEVIPEETLVKVLDEKLTWYIVRVRDRVGWMHGNTLEFINVQAPIIERPAQQTVTPDYRPAIPSTRRSDDPNQTPRVSIADRIYIRGTRRMLLHQRLRPEGLCRSKHVQLRWTFGSVVPH